MRLGRWIGPALAATLTMASAPRAALAACQLVKIGELGVTTDHNEPLAAVTINGHPLRMLVDSGAEKSALWRPALESLGLHAVDSGVKFFGANGPEEAGLVTVREFGLGGYVVHDLTLFVVGRGPNTSFAGLLGEDFLSKFDVEFDLPSRSIRLFTPRDCVGDQVVYWAKAYATTPLAHQHGPEHWPLVTVLLNGHEALALLDSGSNVSGVSADFVRRAGMAQESSSAGAEVHGLGSQPLGSAVATFATLSVGQEEIQNVKLQVADLFVRNRETVTGSFIPVDPINTPDLLIGADFFLAHRIYIARSQGKVYFTYQGGPIFQTEKPSRAD